MQPFLGNSSLATSLNQIRSQAFVKREAIETGKELSSGRLRSDQLVRNGVGKLLSNLNKELSLKDTFKNSAGIAELKLDAVQSSLQLIRKSSSEVSNKILSAVSSGSSATLNILANEATTALEASVGAINRQVGGHSLFSGAALDRSAVLSATSIVADVDAIVASSPDATTALVAIDFYFFDPAGGYATTSYTGTTSDSGSIQVSETTHAKFEVRADDPAIRESLRNMAIMASVSNGAFASSTQDKIALLSNAASTNLNTTSALIQLEEQTGIQQEVVSAAITNNEFERLSFLKKKSELESADPFEAASRLEGLQIQLQSLYHVSAKLSGLSLTNYLR